MALFGTDGVRGIPGEPPLTARAVRRLGLATAAVLLERIGARPKDGSRPLILMGRDTRSSGLSVGRWLARGFAEAGCRTVDLGVVPTPAVAYLTPGRRALCGTVISASHNPSEFNGIKFFTADGLKASPELEGAIESRLSARGGCLPRLGPAAKGTRGGAEREPSTSGYGASRRDAGAVRDYVDFLRSTFPPSLDLSGLRIVFDGSNGAAARIGPELLSGLGAEVVKVGCSPDGTNINTGCGALATARMQREVVRRRAHCGISVDGDADRALLADERGRLLDGDALIALSALHLRGKGLLRGDKVVLTVMSNLGLVRFLASRGIGTVQVPVGDRNVTRALEAEGLVLGGENSGHIVFRRLIPTGDGLLTSLQTLAAWIETGGPLSRVRSLYRSYPQILRNVRVERRAPLEKLAGFQRALREVRRRLERSGRVFVRYSGTEPVLRILVEGADGALTRTVSRGLVRTFRQEVEMWSKKKE
ncbi:MAG: phosphoglucosamine mutase [Elusimicrobiota bacterium]